MKISSALQVPGFLNIESSVTNSCITLCSSTTAANDFFSSSDNCKDENDDNAVSAVGIIFFLIFIFLLLGEVEEVCNFDSIAVLLILRLHNLYGDGEGDVDEVKTLLPL